MYTQYVQLQKMHKRSEKEKSFRVEFAFLGWQCYNSITRNLLVHSSVQQPGTSGEPKTTEKATKAKRAWREGYRFTISEHSYSLDCISSPYQIYFGFQREIVLSTTCVVEEKLQLQPIKYQTAYNNIFIEFVDTHRCIVEVLSTQYRLQTTHSVSRKRIHTEWHCIFIFMVFKQLFNKRTCVSFNQLTFEIGFITYVIRAKMRLLFTLQYHTIAICI